MKRYKGVNISETKEGKFYVPVLHKSYKTLSMAKKAVDKWEHKQVKRDKPEIKKGWW